MSGLVIHRYDQYWSLLLDRPDKHNALSGELVEALHDAFDAAAQAGMAMITLRGQGHCFSAGFDMAGLETQSDGDLLLRFVRIETLLHKIATSPCLTVAFAHGRNFGAGVDLFAACRVRIAAPATTFRMPGLQFGLVLGSARFARIVGRDAAREILETTAKIDTDWALSHGFVTRVEEATAFPARVGEMVNRAAIIPARSRELLYQALNDEDGDAELAMLVRSASAPGLGKRIAAYRAAAAITR